MKKSIILLSAITMVLSICSCQKESRFEYGTKGVSLTATFEEQVDPSATKTYLDNGLVKWSPNDAIKVFYSGGNAYKFDLAEGENTVTARFKYDGDVLGEPQYAIYPYSADASISGSNITFTIPAVQKYVADSFDNGANVAVAQVTTSGMQFRNVCGVLRISLKGHAKVTKLVLTGAANEKLNGVFTVNASSSSPSAAATTTSVDSEKTITLDCSENSVILSDAAASFYFVVPVDAFGTSGFNVKAYGIDGHELSVSLTGDGENIINRSRIRVMPEKTVEGFVLPEEYQVLTYIEANGGDLTGYSDNDYAYLDTGSPVLCGDRFWFEYEPVSSISSEDKGYGCGINRLHNITGGGRHYSGYVAMYVAGSHMNYADAEDNKFEYNASFLGKIYVEEWLLSEGRMDAHLYDLSNKTEYACSAENAELTPSFNSANNLLIFRDARTDGVAYPSNTRLYGTYLQRNDNSFAFILQPALRISESKPGVYDLVSGNFLVNQGTGGADFTYPTPAE